MRARRRPRALDVGRLRLIQAAAADLPAEAVAELGCGGRERVRLLDQLEQLKVERAKRRERLCEAHGRTVAHQRVGVKPLWAVGELRHVRRHLVLVQPIEMAACGRAGGWETWEWVRHRLSTANSKWRRAHCTHAALARATMVQVLPHFDPCT